MSDCPVCRHLSVGVLAAAAAVVEVHGHPDSRLRIASALRGALDALPAPVAEAERLADLNPPETEPETETEETDR